MGFVTMSEWLDNAERLVSRWYEKINDAKSDRRWRADEGEEIYYDGKIDAFHECIQDLEELIDEIYDTLATMESELVPIVREDNEQ